MGEAEEAIRTRLAEAKADEDAREAANQARIFHEKKRVLVRIRETIPLALRRLEESGYPGGRLNSGEYSVRGIFGRHRYKYKRITMASWEVAISDPSRCHGDIVGGGPIYLLSDGRFKYKSMIVTPFEEDREVSCSMLERCSYAELSRILSGIEKLGR